MGILFVFLSEKAIKTVDLVELDDSSQLIQHTSDIALSDLNLLAPNAKFNVVLPANWVTLLKVELTITNLAKVRKAIPYSLEEQVSDDIDTLHFAFDKKHYANGFYEVAIIAKSLMTQLIEQFTENHCTLNTITSELCCLQSNQALLCPNGILIENEHSKACLTTTLFKTIEDSLPKTIEFLQCSDLRWDTLSENQLFKSPVDTGLSYQHWLASQLHQKKGINLLQADFTIKDSSNTTQLWWKMTAGLLVALISFSLIGLGMQYYQLKQINEESKQQILTHYKAFFPNATRVVSPKFRIEQRLKKTSSRDQSFMLVILDKLDREFKNQSDLTIEQIDYRNESIKIKLLAKNFASLEQLKLSLRQSQLQVSQQQAANTENGVNATLEIKQ